MLNETFSVIFKHRDFSRFLLVKNTDFGLFKKVEQNQWSKKEASNW